MHVHLEDLLLALYADCAGAFCGSATLAQSATLKAIHASKCVHCLPFFC